MTCPEMEAGRMEARLMEGRLMEKCIALHVSGDLDPREERIVGEHLLACESCARLADDLRAGLDDLRVLRGEPADEAALAAVRRSVLAEVESKQARTFFPHAWIAAHSRLGWAAAALGVLIAALAGSYWLGRFNAKPQRPTAKIAQQKASPSASVSLSREIAPQEERNDPAQAEVARARPAPKTTPKTISNAPAKPAPQPRAEPRIEIVDTDATGDPLAPPTTLVKLASSDADVVLYWLIESDGD